MGHFNVARGPDGANFSYRGSKRRGRHWIFGRNRGQIGLVVADRVAKNHNHERWPVMPYVGIIELLGLFLMSPREVLVIVLVTAIVVYLTTRSRHSKR